MPPVLYLLLGLAVVGALFYALTQVNRRQQRLHAELTRLERLSAEVTINAEAVLEQVDQRIEQLEALSLRLEERAQQLYEGRVEQATRPLPDRPRPHEAPAPLGSSSPDALAASFEEALQAARALSGQLAPPASQEPPTPESHLHPTAESQPLPAAESADLEAELELPPEPASPVTPADRYAALRQSVYELSKEGKSPLEIAEALAIPRGEVQLILNLKGKKLPVG